MGLLNSKWFSLLLIILAGCFVFVLIELNVRRAEFREALHGAQQRVAQAEAEKTRLEKFIAYFKSPNFLERQARAKLNYKSPEEEVAFVFRDPNKTLADNTKNSSENAPNYIKWWYYILGH